MDISLLNDLLQSYIKIRKELRIIRKEVYKMKKRRIIRYRTVQRKNGVESREIRVIRKSHRDIQRKNVDHSLEKNVELSRQKTLEKQAMPHAKRGRPLKSAFQTLTQENVVKNQPSNKQIPDSVPEKPKQKQKYKTRAEINDSFNKKFDDDLNDLGIF